MNEERADVIVLGGGDRAWRLRRRRRTGFPGPPLGWAFVSGRGAGPHAAAAPAG